MNANAHEVAERGPLPRTLDDYPLAMRAVDDLANQFCAGVQITRRMVPGLSWLATCYERQGAGPAAVFVVDADGTVRSQC